MDPTTSPSNHHQRKRRAQRTPSCTPSLPGHREPHPLSQQRSLELQLNSLHHAVSELKEKQTILINNQQAVRQVLTTMVLPPYLATHLAPLYSLFNLSSVVVTDLPPPPLIPQPSPTEPPLNIPPTSAEATASASDVLFKRTHSLAAPISPSSIYRPYHPLQSSITALQRSPAQQLRPPTPTCPPPYQTVLLHLPQPAPHLRPPLRPQPL